MNLLIEDIFRIALVGLGATLVMDLWLLMLQRLGLASANFAMVGRWVGHWRRGVFTHAAIAKSEPVAGELALGWLTHYVTGLTFGALLAGMCGVAWVRNPTLLPALVFGVGTIVAPWLVMQPAMGAGVAFSRSPSPAGNRLRSLANHAVFGLGLYVAALFIDWISR